MKYRAKTHLCLALLLLAAGQAFPSDVRLAGMGGGCLALPDLENDVFVNPGHLVDLQSKIIFGGLGIRMYHNEHTHFPDETRHSQTTAAYNPSAGAALSVYKDRTYAALAFGGDFGDDFWGGKNDFLLNLRLGQRLGRLGLGAGIDGVFYQGGHHTQLLFGALAGRQTNRLSMSLRAAELGSEHPYVCLDLKWAYQLWRWLGVGHLGNITWGQGYFERTYKAGTGLVIGIAPLRTKVCGDAMAHFEYEPVYSLKEDSLRPGYYNIDQIAGKQLTLSAQGRAGLETQASDRLALRIGLSSWGPDLSLTPFSTVYEPRQVTYTAGATFAIQRCIKVEYAFNGNFEEYTYSSSERHRHYLKAIITY